MSFFLSLHICIKAEVCSLLSSNLKIDTLIQVNDFKISLAQFATVFAECFYFELFLTLHTCEMFNDAFIFVVSVSGNISK